MLHGNDTLFSKCDSMRLPQTSRNMLPRIMPASIQHAGATSFRKKKARREKDKERAEKIYTSGMLEYLDLGHLLFAARDN